MVFNVKEFAPVGSVMGLVLFFLFGLTSSIAFGASTASSIASNFVSDRDIIGLCMIGGAIVALLMMAGLFTAVFASLAVVVGTLKKKLIDRA